jgi:hypothetical protein
MKTPLMGGDAIIRAMLLEHWQLALTHIHFIPHGESAYSYRVETQQGSPLSIRLVHPQINRLLLPLAQPRFYSTSRDEPHDTDFSICAVWYQ